MHPRLYGIRFSSLLVLAAGTIVGCDTLPSIPSISGQGSRIAFTESLRDEWNLTDEEIKSLQFYVHDKVVLSREVIDGSRSIANGKLVLRSGKYIDEIVLTAGTPGVVTIVWDDALGVCFETSCESVLEFGCRSHCDETGGRYRSFASNWEDHIGQVTYAGQTYSMTPSTHVEIDKDALAEVEKNRRILPGKRLDSN